MTELRSCPNGLCVLSGGVGGAKLVLGLSQVLNNDDFMTIVNTGDDFVHLGLKICPDIDTIIYTLACLLYTSPSPRDRQKSRMPSSA